jgi:hypothetical protein
MISQIHVNTLDPCTGHVRQKLSLFLSDCIWSSNVERNSENINLSHNLHIAVASKIHYNVFIPWDIFRCSH